MTYEAYKAEDKVYQEDLEKRKKEGWYDGK